MNRDDLIAAMRSTASAAPTPVEVDGWGVMYVRPPTVAEVDAARKQEEPEDDKQFARGACRVICDKDGARIFDAMNEDDVNLLASQPWSMLTKVIAAASVANGSKTDQGGN